MADAATRGTLVVHLRSATNLRSADRGGYSDPYVKLKVNATEFKSKVIDKSLNPTWDSPSTSTCRHQRAEHDR